MCVHVHAHFFYTAQKPRQHIVHAHAHTHTHTNSHTHTLPLKQNTFAYIYAHTYYIPATAAKPLPPHYICNRCQTPGHWIKDCPKNNVFFTFGGSGSGIGNEETFPVNSDLTSWGARGGGGGGFPSTPFAHTSRCPRLESNNVTMANMQVYIYLYAYISIYTCICIHVYVYVPICRQWAQEFEGPFQRTAPRRICNTSNTNRSNTSNTNRSNSKLRIHSTLAQEIRGPWLWRRGSSS